MKGGLFMTSNRFFQFTAIYATPLASCGPWHITLCGSGVLAAAEN